MKILLVTLLSKGFGLLIKHFSKKQNKQRLIKELTAALDTNHDGKLTLEDFANGRWKDINWFKLAFVIIIAIGAYYGYVTL
jgi:hypothetical protein